MIVVWCLQMPVKLSSPAQCLAEDPATTAATPVTTPRSGGRVRQKLQRDGVRSVASVRSLKNRAVGHIMPYFHESDIGENSASTPGRAGGILCQVGVFYVGGSEHGLFRSTSAGAFPCFILLSDCCPCERKLTDIKMGART